MSVSRKLARNFFALLAGNVVGQVFNLLALLYLASALTSSAFGLWNVASAWMAYLLRAGEFGLEIVGLRHVARNPEKTHWWIVIIVLIRAVLALLLFGATLFLASLGLLPSSATTLVILFALMLFPMAFTTEWVFEARQEVAAITFARIAKGLIFLVLVVLFVRNVYDTEKAALFYVLSVTIPTCVLLFLTAKRFGFDTRGFTVSEGLRAIRESTPIGIATILTNYNFFAGTLIAGYMLSGSELGYFTAAHRLVIFVWAYVIVTFHRVLIPTLTRYFHESKENYVRFVRRFFNLGVISAIPCGIIGSLASDRIIQLLYPSEYGPAAATLNFLLWALAMAMGRSIFEIALIASERQRRYLNGVIFVSIAYTIVTPLLILQMGIVGAALACLIVETLYFVTLLLSFPHAAPSILGHDIWKPIVGAIAAIVPAMFISSSQRVWFLPVSFALYVGVLIVSKGISINDYRMIQSILGKKMVDQVY